MSKSFFLFFMLVTPSFAASVGMVQVSSVYEDGPQKRRETGTGWVIEDNGKKYLVSDAHLLAGADQRLNKDILLSEKEIIFDNDNDLAIMELKESSLPAALIYDEKEKKFLVSNSFQKASDDGLLKIRASSFPGKYSHRTFIPPWALPLKTEILEPVNAELNRQRVPEITGNGKQIHVFDKTTPGMSGTILLGNEYGKQEEVLGFLAQYNYYFDDSYYTSAHLAAELLEKYKKGKRGSQSDTKWHMKNGLTYRTFGLDTAETSFVEKSAGNGIYIDPGDGVYIDPGNGIYIDPGDGVYIDPGIPCAREPEDLVKLEKNSRELLNAMLKTRTLAPNEIYYRYGIRPGLLWKGKPILGFVLRDKQGKELPFALYANPQALDFLRTNSDRYDIEPIGSDASLTDLLRMKARYAFSDSDTPSIQGKTFRLNTRKGSASGVVADVQVSPMGVKLKLRGDILSKENAPEYVNLDLDKNGWVKGSQFFTPIVEAYGEKTKNRYFVDLRRLFFTDLGNVSQSLLTNSEEPKDFSAALEAQKKAVYVSSRSEIASNEYSYEFVPSDCPEPDAQEVNYWKDYWLDLGKHSRPRCNKSP
jgi:hypothetical protein